RSGPWFLVRSWSLVLGPSVGSWSVPGPWSSVVRWFLVRSGSLVLGPSLVPGPQSQSPVPRPQAPGPVSGPTLVLGPSLVLVRVRCLNQAPGTLDGRSRRTKNRGL